MSFSIVEDLDLLAAAMVIDSPVFLSIDHVKAKINKTMECFLPSEIESPFMSNSHNETVPPIG